MQPWYSIRLTKEDWVQGKVERLVADFQEIFRRSESSGGVFADRVSSDAWELYISPDAAPHCLNIIHRFSGVRSTPPPPTARHLFGSPAAMKDQR